MSETKKNWRTVKNGAITFKNTTKAAIYYLNHSKMSQSEIARKIGCTPALVCQIRAKLS